LRLVRFFFGKTCVWSTAAAVIAALWLGLSAPAPADEPPYPVWWSPVLELDSIEGIDARLERTFWPGIDEGMPLIKTEAGSISEVWAVNCIELKRSIEDGFHGAGSNDRAVVQYHVSVCRAMELLKRVAPARKSFIRNFAFDLTTVEILPAMVDLSPSCDFICREVVANDRRIPLSRFHDILLVQIMSETEMVYWSEDWKIRLVVLAQADFNADGVEDLLLLSKGGSISGTGSWAELFLITRSDPNQVLWIVNADQYLCPDYQCQPSYDYPEALSPDYSRCAVKGSVSVD
jgi:hypothetical protein